MKLVSVHISSFGKLRDFHYDFCDGLNVLCERNGFGKTTLATFVKAMFYGIGGSKKSDLFQNDHKRYHPFNSTEKFGGSMCFEHSGRVFRVERFFGNTPREHTFLLYDEASGKLLQKGVEDAQGELGFRLFGLDADAFERCLYLPQKEVVVASNDSFVQKLSNLAENSTEQNNCQRACDNLTKFYKNYKLDKGEGGILLNLKKQREEKQKQLDENRQTQQKIDYLNRSIMETLKDLQRVDWEQAEVKQRLASAEKSLAETGNLEAIKNIQNLLDSKRQEQQKLKQQLTELGEIAEPIAPQQEETPVFEEKKTKSKKPLQAVFAVLAIASISLFFLAWYLGAIGVALFGALFVWTTVAQQKQNKKEILLARQAEKEKLAREEKAQKKQSEYQTALEEYRQKRQEAQETQIRLSATAITIEDLLGQLQTLAPGGVNNVLTQAQSLKAEQEALLKKSNEYALRCDALKKRLAEDTKELKLREERFCLPAETEGEIEELSARITQAQVNYSCAKRAVELLKKAKENLTMGYLPKLNALLNQNLSLLNIAEFNQATVDANFEVKLLMGGQMRETAYLSTGLREVCNFVLRVSLMQCIYGEDLPLLILDDPFVNFDEDNYKSIYELIDRLSQKTQILYLTCQKR